MHLRLLLTLILIHKAVSLPLGNDTNPDDDDFEEDFDYEFYDQRQNGSENYRINVNGVVFFMAPLKSLFGPPGLDEHEGEDGEVEPGLVIKPNVTVNQSESPVVAGREVGNQYQFLNMISEKGSNQKISKQKP